MSIVVLGLPRVLGDGFSKLLCPLWSLGGHGFWARGHVSCCVGCWLVGWLVGCFRNSFAVGVLTSSLGVGHRNRVRFDGRVSLVMLDRGALCEVSHGVSVAVPDRRICWGVSLVVLLAVFDCGTGWETSVRVRHGVCRGSA